MPRDGHPVPHCRSRRAPPRPGRADFPPGAEACEVLQKRHALDDTALVHSQQVAHLTFHGLGDPVRDFEGGERDYWVERDVFRAIVERIRGEPDITVCFDDGNASDREIALPVLLDAGMTATFFVLAGKLGEPGYLSRSDLQQLADAGMRIGTHGMHHRAWRGLRGKAAREEIFDARETLQQLTGEPVEWAACPFGEYDRRTLSQLRSAGCTRVFTSDGGIARRDAWLQPRHSVRRDDNPEKLLSRVQAKPSMVAARLRQLKLTLKRLR